MELWKSFACFKAFCHLFFATVFDHFSNLYMTFSPIYQTTCSHVLIDLHRNRLFWSTTYLCSLSLLVWTACWARRSRLCCSPELGTRTPPRGSALLRQRSAGGPQPPQELAENTEGLQLKRAKRKLAHSKDFSFKHLNLFLCNTENAQKDVNNQIII